MKGILILCGLLLLGAVTWFFVFRPGCRNCCGPGLRGLERAEISRMLDKPADYLKKEVQIEGNIARQCPCCACWFMLQDAGGRELKVEAGDLADPLPYRPGRKATVEGSLIRYGDGYEFVATAVEIH